MRVVAVKSNGSAMNDFVLTESTCGYPMSTESTSRWNTNDNLNRTICDKSVDIRHKLCSLYFEDFVPTKRMCLKVLSSIFNSLSFCSATLLV